MRVLALLLALAIGPVCQGESAIAGARTLALMQEWDIAQYTSPDDRRRAMALKGLGARIDALPATRAGDVRYLVWRAAVLAAEADATDGPQALFMAARAKRLLEVAARHNPSRETSSVLEATLGALYFNAPGFPLGFGDDAVAESHFVAAVRADPDNPESQFYYGDFLLSQHRDREAAVALRHALDDLPRPGRAIGDTGLTQQIEAELVIATRQNFGQ